MHQVAVIFWSGTGNTEAMAKAITEGVNKAGGEAQLFNVADIHVDRAASYDYLILGCPSMGGEVLEEYEFEPFYTALEEKINGKKSHSSVPMAGEMASGCAIGKRASRTMGETFLKKVLLSTTCQIRLA